MAQMAAALGAVKFGPHQAMAGIAAGFHRARQGVEEAGPAGAAVELGGGVEQFVAAAGALELTGALFVIKGAGARTLGAMLAQHAMLLGGQFTLFGLGHPVSFLPAYMGTIFRDSRRSPY